MRRRRQRGATLTGYALIMSAMVAVSLSAVKGLDEGSTTVLEETGASIGEARPTRDELALLIEEEDPDGVINGPGPGPTPTYSWSSNYTGIITTPSPNDLCIVNDGGTPKTGACSSTSGSFEFFENADDDNDQVQLRLDGLCVTRVSTNAATALQACVDGNEDQMWLKTPSGNLANAGAPGECLDVAGGLGAPGASILSYGCHGDPNQTFSFPGPYVPPVVEVTSVSASSASISAPFQLGGDGYLSAPDGTGNTYNSPDPSLGNATFTFTVAAAGQYKINGDVYAGPNGGNDDSFWVTTSLDGNSAAYKWGIGSSQSPHNSFVNTDNGAGNDVVLDIPAGATFTITLSTREDGAHLGSLSLVQIS